jgi:hypothetical protein
VITVYAHSAGDTTCVERVDPAWLDPSSDLVTVHDGHSRSIARLKEVCDRHARVLAEGPSA